MPISLVRAPLPEMLGPWLTWVELTILQRATRALHLSLLPEWTDLEGLVWIACAMASRPLAHKGLLDLWMDQAEAISPALNLQSGVMLEHIGFVLRPLRTCLSASTVLKQYGWPSNMPSHLSSIRDWSSTPRTWTSKSMAVVQVSKRYRSFCRSLSNLSSFGCPYLSWPQPYGRFW